jgi:hypothetical protein
MWAKAQREHITVMSYKGEDSGRVEAATAIDLRLTLGDAVGNLQILYCFEAALVRAIDRVAEVDELIARRNLKAVKDVDRRYRVQHHLLSRRCRDGKPISVTFRNGRRFRGAALEQGPRSFSLELAPGICLYANKANVLMIDYG